MIPALCAYGAVVLVIGLLAARKARLGEDAFLLGSRQFGRLSSWAALSSTTIGGSTTLVLAALVGSRGLPAVWLDLAGALGLLALGLFLARRVRATAAVTLAAVVGRAYGEGVRRVAATLVVVAEVVWFALLVQATETVVTALTPWPATPVLLLTAAVFIAYTVLGGQRAVIGTDVFQLALMLVSLAGVAFPLAVASLARTGAPAALLSFPVGPRFGWADAFGMLVLVGLPHAVGSDVWAKLLSARDEETARAAALGAAATKLLFGAVTASVALAGVGLGLAPGPALFPQTVVALAPSAAPLLLVGLVATMQSSADSVLLSAAAATTHDLLGKPSAGLARLLVGVYGAAGLALALALRDLVETFRLGYSLFASALILPTLLAFVPRVRMPRAASGAAMLLGGGVTLSVWLARPSGTDPVLAGTAVNAAVLLLGAFAGAVTGKPPAPLSDARGARSA